MYLIVGNRFRWIEMYLFVGNRSHWMSNHREWRSWWIKIWLIVGNRRESYQMEIAQWLITASNCIGLHRTTVFDYCMGIKIELIVLVFISRWATERTWTTVIKILNFCSKLFQKTGRKRNDNEQQCKATLSCQCITKLRTNNC